ncbi:hypothetical protein [Alcanivorax sp. NBRC 102028]|uniref:hypothetical protein n=1 Tax=Alcanivorax sp. NBRC 102028 TaxID=1113897 RepID=UPI000789CDDF|nr:hypothetical protein [Alcanivorax sp. NBRC 102028]
MSTVLLTIIIIMAVAVAVAVAVLLLLKPPSSCFGQLSYRSKTYRFSKAKRSFYRLCPQVDGFMPTIEIL